MPYDTLDQIINQSADEKEILDKIILEIMPDHKIRNCHKKLLKRIFTDRFTRALNIVEKKAVRKYLFKPSLREVWTVHGRTQSYQVMPSSNYCSCDDFFFRVMDDKKKMCYHIIAQRLADALNMFEVVELPDSSYARITRKWRSTKKSITF
ncbi:MAG: hypothetical protein ACFFFT_16040 [Candidatus Thorarchaeota archaeon]